jgi:hypothetical protein
MIWAQIAGWVAVGLMLAGCSSNRLLNGETTSALQASKDDMTGRWILSAPDAPTCGLNFNGAPGASEGAIAPDGGCPGAFFMSRHWAVKQGALEIDDADAKPLAQLTFADGRYAGQSRAGLPVTLAR